MFAASVCSRSSRFRIVASEALARERVARQLLAWAPRHRIPPKLPLNTIEMGMRTVPLARYE
eukprot:1933243-Pyramimonas_sp.AAC.1